MGIGAGILIAAIGAILSFAVTAEISGVDVQTVGTIMIIAGIIIALISAVMTASRSSRYGRRDAVVVDERPPDTRI